MGDWISKHPWMTFFLALAGIGAVRTILSPPGATPSGTLMTLKTTVPAAPVTVVSVIPHGSPTTDGAKWSQPMLLLGSDGLSYPVAKSYDLISYAGGTTSPSLTDQSNLVNLVSAAAVGRNLTQYLAQSVA